MKEKQRKYRRKYKEKQNQNRDLNTQFETPTNGDLYNYSNRMQKSRALKTFRDALPRTPMCRLKLLQNYLKTKSPTTAKIIDTMKENEVNIKSRVFQNIKETINQTNRKRTRENLNCRQKLFAAMYGDNVRKHKGVTHLTNKLGIKRQTFKKAMDIRKVTTESNAFIPQEPKRR